MSEARGINGGKLMAAVVVSFLFVFSRVLGAYWLQNSTNPDYSVVVLMAKHMAQGVDYPLFFYGQAYMGSLEPMLSALLCRMVGFSGFTVCMGTVFFSVAMVPFIYLLGRNAGGWLAGIAALLFCVIGPSGFFHYAASPRGGYAAALFFTVFILWAILELAWREVQGVRCSWATYLGLGFVGGIACWTDPLVSPAIIAGSIMFLVVMGRRTFMMRRLYLVLPGFVLGMGPFFIWNFQNEWSSVGMLTQATRSVDFTKGLRLFFVRATDLFDYSGLPLYWSIPMSCLYLGILLCAVTGLAKSFRPTRPSRGAITLAGVILFIIVFIICFSHSDFASVKTPRYLLPIVPAVGVLAGYAVSVQRGKRKVAALCVLLCICAFQLFHLRIFLELKDKADDILARSSQLDRYLAENEVKSIYGELPSWCLNYILNERYLIYGVDLERYDPYMQRIEKARSVALLNPRPDYARLCSSLRVSYQSGNPGGFEVWHDFSRQRAPYSEISSNLVASVTDSAQREFSDKVFDRSLLTAWSTGDNTGGGRELTVSFTESVPVEGLRFICRPRYYPDSWILYGRNGLKEDWHKLVAQTAITPFFWSGQRFFAKGSFFRVEGSFAPVSCTQLKLVFPSIRPGAGLRISEIQVYVESLSDAAVQNADVSSLAKWLENIGVETVFADRWESNQLYGRCRCKVVRDHGVYAHRELDDGVEIKLDRSTALVVNSTDAAWTMQVLDGYGVHMSRHVVGQWTIFYFDDTQWHQEYAQVTGLLWVGFGCVSESLKHPALALARMAEKEYAKDGMAAHAIGRMKEALDTYGNYRDGVGKMAVWLANEGRTREAMIWQDRFEGMWLPAVKASADFGGRAQLLGITADYVAVAPGTEMKIRYYWKCKPDSRLRDLVIFAHFKRGKTILFQDDRPFLADKDVLYQPFQEVFIEERTVKIPYNVSAGDCEIWMGLYDLAYKDTRLSVHTDLDEHNASIRLPIVLKIAE